MVSFGTHTCKSANVADHVSGKYYTVSTCGHSLIHMCTCIEVIIRRSWKERYTCLVQTAAVVAHALYHGEGKEDSEGVGETNWVHNCTPSNHLTLAQNTSLWVSLSLSSKHHVKPLSPW